MFVDDIADVVFFAFLNVIFPAAGVGAGTLVRVTLVDVSREQATTGVGHAQRAVNEDFDFHIRHLRADLFNLFQRKFTRQNDAGQPHLFPEFHRCPVNGVGLNGEVNIHLREVLPNQHN